MQNPPLQCSSLQDISSFCEESRYRNQWVPFLQLQDRWPGPGPEWVRSQGPAFVFSEAVTEQRRWATTVQTVVLRWRRSTRYKQNWPPAGRRCGDLFGYLISGGWAGVPPSSPHWALWWYWSWCMGSEGGSDCGLGSLELQRLLTRRSHDISRRQPELNLMLLLTCGLILI